MAMNKSRQRNEHSDSSYSPHSVEENEEDISEDVLEQVISTLKHNSESSFLISGKTIEMPNNLFNSEDTVVTMNKSDQSFHLYKYVINKKDVAATNRNKKGWNMIVNELRQNIKKISSKSVITEMELTIVNNERMSMHPQTGEQG